MKYLPNQHVLLLAGLLSFAACGNLSQEVENRLNDLQNKTESLDSLINTEVDKVLALDSLILEETEKVKKLDTLINNSASQIDSMARKGRN